MSKKKKAMQTEYTFYRDQMEVPVKMESRKGLPPEEYVAKEMDGVESSEWMNFVAERTTVLPSGKATKISNFKGYMERLIGKCLFTKNGDKVGEDVIERFPSSAKAGLFRLCRELNGLDDDSEEDEKNE